MKISLKMRHHWIWEAFLIKAVVFYFCFYMINVVFRSKYFFILENPSYWPNFAIFDFTNTVKIMIKMRSGLPSPNISFIRPLFNYLLYYNIRNKVQTPLPNPLICVKMRYASPDFYKKRLYM